MLPLRNSLMERPAAEIVSLVDGGAVAEQVTEHWYLQAGQGILILLQTQTDIKSGFGVPLNYIIFTAMV